jgi:hypothetical protein
MLHIDVLYDLIILEKNNNLSSLLDHNYALEISSTYALQI